MNGAALSNLQFMAHAIAKNRSIQGHNDGGRRKMLLEQAAAAFGIIQRDTTSSVC